MQPPAAVHVGENVGESNKSIPGYRRCPPGGNAGKLIPKCNGIPLSHARTSSFVAPAMVSRRLFRSDSPRANARNERWALELGGFSRGNSARRSNDYILHHLSLPISIYFYTRRERLARVVICDRATHSHLRRRSKGFPLLLPFLSTALPKRKTG